MHKILRQAGDLSANHSFGTVEICTQKYGVYDSSSFGGVRVIISALFGRVRVGNSARLPARARTARGGTLFGPFWRARACSRHRSQEQSDNKNSTIDTTNTWTTYLRVANITVRTLFHRFLFCLCWSGANSDHRFQSRYNTWWETNFSPPSRARSKTVWTTTKHYLKSYKGKRATSTN